MFTLGLEGYKQFMNETSKSELSDLGGRWLNLKSNVLSDIDDKDLVAGSLRESNLPLFLYRAVLDRDEEIKRLNEKIQGMNKVNPGLQKYHDKLRRGEFKPARKRLDVNDIVLYRNQGYSLKDIAEMFGVSVPTIRSRLKEVECE